MARTRCLVNEVEATVAGSSALSVPSQVFSVHESNLADLAHVLWNAQVFQMVFEMLEERIFAVHFEFSLTDPTGHRSFCGQSDFLLPDSVRDFELNLAGSRLNSKPRILDPIDFIWDSVECRRQKECSCILRCPQSQLCSEI